MLEILRRHMGNNKREDDSVAEKLLRTLTCDLGGRWDHSDPSHIDDVEIRAILAALRSHPEQPPSPWLLRLRSESLRCTSRSWHRLEKHTLALGPRVTRPGDLVVILDGSCLPCVVRRRGVGGGISTERGVGGSGVPSTERGNGEGGYFELVGQCFVDGIMYGEEGPEEEEESEVFWLV